MRRIDLTNKRVGMLTAKEPSHTNAHGDVIWKCQCDCGNICYVAASSLRHSRTKSCGCMRKEWIAKKLKRYNEYVHYDIEARIKAEKDYFKEYAPYQEGEVKED